MTLLLLASARAGELEGELAVDGLHASAASDAVPGDDGDGAFAAQELGLRVRGTVEEGRVLGAVDYQGRQPLPGELEDRPFHLLYRAEVVGDVVEDRLELAVGRFLAPSVVFLPVDGLRTVIRPSDALRVELFGGRRGISTARVNLAPGELLPAVGGLVGYTAERATADVGLAWAGDQVALGAGDEPYTEDFRALNAQARATLRPADVLIVGGSAALAQRATYVLSPDPELVLPVQALDLYHLLGFVSWRPSDDVRVDYDAIHQAAELSRSAVEVSPPSAPALIDPTFTDNRLKAALRPADLGWIRPDVRLRLREARAELRYGVGVDVDHLGVPGPFLAGRIYVDDVLMDSTGDDVAAVDRLLWSASGGYRKGGFEAEAGASFIDRKAAPVSGLGSSPGAPVASDDLAPFVLEAENLLFARSFVSGRRWFGGADVEVNALDPEVRAFVQLGVLTEARW